MRQKILGLTVFMGLLGINHMAAAQASTEQKGSSQYVVKPRPVDTPSEYRPHFGILAGIAAPEGSYDAASNLGVEVGFQPYIPFSLGAEYSTHSLESRDNARTIDRHQALLRANYNFSGDNFFKYFYAGAGVGLLIEDGTNYGGLVPLVGFDYPLTESISKFVSLGAQARYTLTSSNNPDVFSMNGSLKYWF